MQKLYNAWNEIKQVTQLTKSQKFYIKQREIWSTKMWLNIWYEQSGKWEGFERPVLVLKKIWSMYLCASLTTHWKENDFYHKLPENISRKDSYVILSQPKLFDIKRFHYKIGVVPEEEFKKVQKKLKTLWF